MAFLKRWLANLMTGKKFKEITQPQREAFIDAIALAVVADGQIAPQEMEELKQATALMGWEGEADDYVERALSDALIHLTTPETTRARVDDISARLITDWLREEAYYVAARTSAADASVDESERQFLQTLVLGFGISRQRLAVIAEKIMGETSFV